MVEEFPDLPAFAAVVGDAFAVTGDEALRLTLVEATSLGLPVLPQGGRAPFSLLFAGDGAALLPQGTYELRHPALGDLHVFLVPTRHEDGRPVNQAIFT